MDDTPDINAPRTGSNLTLVLISLLPLALHLASNALGGPFENAAGYGIYRDEYYYVACSKHLDWGYVDHPPLSLLILAFNRALFGDSILALRILPAVAGSTVVVLAGLMAREMGGGRLAQATAAVAAVFTPVYLAIFDFYSMNAFDILFWSLCFLVLIRIVRTENTRFWLLFGLLAGMGLQNKTSVLFLGAALAVGLLISPHRWMFLDRRLWLGGMVAAIIFLPYLIWEGAHGWPTLEFMLNASRYKNIELSAPAFFGQQFLLAGPQNAVVWIPGFLFLLFSRSLRRYRIFAYMYIVLFIIFTTQNGKPYYLGPAYTILFAAGATAIEHVVDTRGRRWLGIFVLVFLTVGGAVSLPMAVPVLPPEDYIEYLDAIGMEPHTEERGEVDRLGQHYSDMHGWREMAETVARVYHDLPPEEQRVCVIFGQNYGQAGAIDYYAEELGLPGAVSGHNSYWYWGPGETRAEVVIIIGGDYEDHADECEECIEAARIEHEWARWFEANQSVWVCRGFKPDIGEIWPEVRSFN
jgi:hypothetical protein